MSEKSSRVTIQLNFKKIHQVLLLILGLNLFFLFGTWLSDFSEATHWPNAVKRLFAQLNLGSENVAASWYSSLLLLLVGLAAGHCFLADNQRLISTRDRILNLGWIVFVMIFLILSFDEMGSFHEVIGKKGVSGGGWYIFYVLIAAVGIFMMLFSLLRFFRNWGSLGFAVIGVLLFLSNPIQENYETAAMLGASNPATWHRPVTFLLLEEGSEIFGSYCLLFSFAIYLRFSVLKIPWHNDSAPKLKVAPRQRLLKQTALAMILVSLVMFALQFFLPRPRISGGGVAENWFPSATAFFTCLVILYFISTLRLSKALCGLLVVIAFFHAAMSLFFGANFYGYDDLFFKVLTIILLTGTIIGGIFMAFWFENVGAKFAAVAGTILQAGNLFASKHSLPLSGYLVFALFLYSIAANFSDRRIKGVKS